MVLSAATEQATREVCAQFGIEPSTVHDIRIGRVNKHWRVVAPDATYALRRYRGTRSLDAIAYEHDIIKHIEALDWPVAAPIESARGETVVAHEGRNYSLFPFLEGRPAPQGNLSYLRIKGALLARLHQDLERAPRTEQRDGFGRTWELDVTVRAESPYDSLSGLLAAFRRQHPELGSAINRQKYAVLRELARLGYGDLPDQVVHADFFHYNVLFQRANLSGLLDFDIVRRDARVADIATSLALDCSERPEYNALVPEAVHAFLTGYTERRSLEDRELRLVVPLVGAHFLGLVVWRLAQWPKGDLDAIRSIDRSINKRLPALAERRPVLEDAVARAAATGGVDRA